MTTAATTPRTFACPTRRKPPLSRLLDRLRTELHFRRDRRRVLQLSPHLLRDIGLDDTDLRRALRQGRR